METNHLTEGGALGALPPDCTQQTLGIAFIDLSRISEWSDGVRDALVADFFQRFYQLTADQIEPAGGRVVKFMGDAGLIVFDPDHAEPVIDALATLAGQVRQMALDVGLNTYLNINVHVGPALAGSFGPAGHERFDIIGKSVNIAARLGRRGMVLSPQAFRCLSDEARKRFEKRMGPITYHQPTG